MGRLPLLFPGPPSSSARSRSVSAPAAAEATTRAMEEFFELTVFDGPSHDPRDRHSNRQFLAKGGAFHILHCTELVKVISACLSSRCYEQLAATSTIMLNIHIEWRLLCDYMKDCGWHRSNRAHIILHLQWHWHQGTHSDNYMCPFNLKWDKVVPLCSQASLYNSS